MSTLRIQGKRGFTLVELIVSIGLFIIVLTIVASAYLSLISLNRKARATNDLVSNLSYVVEAMSRTIRTGTNYQCGGLGGTNCATFGNSTFSFTDDQTRPVTFSLAGGAINQSIAFGTPDILTDPRITITNLKFYVQGVGSGDQMQPRVLFTMSGTITPDANSAAISFTIESSATQRLIEL
ncbi:MAG: putative Type pilus pilin [Parcubacteria group bacterium]|nr:putative Type pilus pilin [Parcubacteria group bacterium]